MVLGVEAARRATMQLPAAAVIGGCVVLSLVLVYADPAWIRPHASHCWYAWVWALPTMPLGLAFGRLLAVDRAPRRRWHLMPLAAVFAAVSLAIWLWMESLLALRFAEGALLIAIGFALPGPSGAWSRRLLTLSIGIFLCHPLVLRLLLPFVRDLAPIAVVPIVWGLSAVLAFGLQQTPLARFAGERAPVPRLAGSPAADARA